MTRDLVPMGINVNAICPGPIDTDMVANLSEEVKDSVKSRIFTGRLGSPEEIGATAVFFASDKANFITGKIITVDGILICYRNMEASSTRLQLGIRLINHGSMLD